MKELSIEEKAKAYDEAVKKVNDYYEGKTKLYSDVDKTLDYLFPELKESEEEKIKSILVDFFKNYYENTSMYFEGVEVRNIIAWLEKQGKKIDAIENFDTEFEKQVSYLIASAINREYEYNQSFVKWAANGLLEYAKHENEKNNMGISEATKQKLEDNLNKALEKETPESCNEFLDEQDKKKPAKQPQSLDEEIEEWLGCEAFPEETNITPLPKAIEIVRKTANHFYDFGRKQQAIRNIQHKNLQVITPESHINEGKKKGIQIVLDNPQEYGLQKISKWSEEDERMIDTIIYDLERHGGKEDSCYSAEITWLKSLKERYTWKPSDEQMEGIECTIKTLKYQLNAGDNRLNSLYNDLRKLRGE